MKKLDDVQKELANAQKELDDSKLQLEEALRRNSELESQIRTTENSEHMRPDLLHGQNS